jgi:hypothetical protein
LSKAFGKIGILLLGKRGQENQIEALFLKTKLQLKQIVEEEFPVLSLPSFNVQRDNGHAFSIHQIYVPTLGFPNKFGASTEF